MSLGVAVSDAGPIHYLVLIEEIAVLPQLFKKVMLPPEVHGELLHSNAPANVRDWFQSVPPWIKIQVPGLTITRVAKPHGYWN